MNAGRTHLTPSRQIRILSGYALACLTSAIVLAMIFAVPARLSSSRPQWQAGGLLGDVAALTIFIAPTIVALTLLPAALFVWWAEKRGVRRFIAYAGAGMAMAVLGSTVFFWKVDGTTLLGTVFRSTCFILAGFVAGATYWLVAGRRT